MPNPRYFWVLTEQEVQEYAKKLVKKRLTLKQFYRAEKMFSDGIQWQEVLEIAIKEVTRS